MKAKRWAAALISLGLGVSLCFTAALAASPRASADLDPDASLWTFGGKTYQEELDPHAGTWTFGETVHQKELDPNTTVWTWGGC